MRGWWVAHSTPAWELSVVIATGIFFSDDGGEMCVEYLDSNLGGGSRFFSDVGVKNFDRGGGGKPDECHLTRGQSRAGLGRPRVKRKLKKQRKKWHVLVRK